MAEYKRLKRELVAKGTIIDYYRDTMQVPNGDTAVWDFVKHKGAAAMIAVEDDGRLLMVRQYRGPLERETLEIPAGGRKSEDEPTDLAAVRELKEESGYDCTPPEFLISVCSTVAFSNEKIDIYVTHILDQGERNLDADEEVSLEDWSVDDLIDKIYAGEIQDSKTICGILAYARKYGIK